LQFCPYRTDTSIMTLPPIAVVALSLATVGCGGSPSPAPSPSTVPTAPTPAPTPGGQTFTVALPIRPAERANNAFGLNPFGIHIGDHGIDGHPGWDIEYAAGASVLAAADGTVQSVLPSEGGQAFGIQITHTVGGRAAYRTIYGVRTLAPGVSAGVSVTAGQPLGTVASYTRTIGTITVSYGFTHFQLDDFSSNAGLTNPNAVSPETFLNSEARQTFEAMWRDAFYPQELVEPFVTNPRDVTFPMTRAWRLESGGLSARLEFTRADAFSSGFSYVMRDGSGAVVETGVVEIEALAKPVPTLDFIPAGSSERRRGLYSILDGTMRIDYGAPGAARPASLTAASSYTTDR
jgi:peptidase M23-like protein